MPRPASLKPVWHLALTLCSLILCAGPVSADDTAVIFSGNWSSPGTWSGASVPGPGDNAFVGSTTPAGALTSATVNLSLNVTAGNVYLGHDTGTSGTLDLGNFTFTANDLFFGFVGTGTITRGTGHLNVIRFDIRNGNSFTIASTDVIQNALHVHSGSSVTLSAPLIVADKIDLTDNGTVLNAQNFNIQATNEILLGWNGTGAALVNRGTITTGRMNVRGQNFDLRPTDAVGHFIMRAGATNLESGVVVGRLELGENATGTTTQTSNITTGLLVESGSTLMIGAPLSLSDNLNLRGNGTALNANGHNIAATNELLIGWDGGNPALQNRGTLTANNLLVRNQSFQLNPTDSIANFHMSNGGTNLSAGVAIQRLTLSTNATATIGAATNVSRSVNLQSGSSLLLNANLTLTESVNLSGAGTTLNANTHDITTSGQFLHGWDGSGKPTISGIGKLVVGELYQGNAAELALGSGQDSTGRIHLRGNSRLSLTPSAAGNGLTLTRTAASELSIESGSHLTLSGNGIAESWAFRWANPAVGDHVSELNNLISLGRIDFTFQGGATVSNLGDGFTYIMVPVPEPASVLGICGMVAGLGAGARRWRNRRNPRT